MAWKAQLLPRTVNYNKGCSGKRSQTSLLAREKEGCDSTYYEAVFFCTVVCAHIERIKGLTCSLPGRK